MVITLGGVELPRQIQWIDRDAWSPVAQSVERTLDGGQAIFAAGLQAGRPITLEADAGVAWITDEQRQAVLALAAQPGSVFQLAWGTEFYSVMFRHHDAPAVELRPLRPNSGWFVGQIKLVTV
ncbi:MAG: hypothetical protein HQL51_03915 [Magnetococcales bacterium]|nr:hypothetical protein [Magnetococcales bacterium]